MNYLEGIYWLEFGKYVYSILVEQFITKQHNYCRKYKKSTTNNQTWTIWSISFLIALPVFIDDHDVYPLPINYA